MFCPSCGAESNVELNYCKRCGANLNLSVATSSEAVQVSVVKPILILGLIMLFLTLGGFAGVISGVSVLVKNSGGGDLTMAIVFLGLVTILVVDILLVRLLSKLINAALDQNQQLPAKRTMTKTTSEFELPRTLPEHVEPVDSVTDRTTRFFESAARESLRAGAHDKTEAT